MYEAWIKQRDPRAPYCVCAVSQPAPLPLHRGADGLVDPDTNWRDRARFCLMLDQKFPEASIPTTPTETLIFMERCRFIGCTLEAGAWMRTRNRKEGFLWP